MMLVYFLCIFTCLFVSNSLADRHDGEYIFGAIIPIHDAGSKPRSCGLINTKGAAIAEAIKLAVNTINNKKTLLGVKPFSRTLGFDIRDSCNDIERAKDFAYEFNKQHRYYQQTKKGKNPVSVVLGRFTEKQSAVMELLAFEKLPQISYVADNIQLDGKSTNKNDMFLISTFPGDFYKLKATVAILKSLKIEFVTMVVSNNEKAKKNSEMIKKEFKSNIDSCLSNEFVINSQQSIKDTVSQIKRNPLVKVVVLQLNREESLSLFKEAKEQNLTGIIWFSTVPWKDNMDALKAYSKTVEGMVFVDNKEQDALGFHLYLTSLKRPYNNSAVLQELFVNMGGSKQCLDGIGNLTSTAENECDTVHKKMINALMKYKSDAAYTIDAVYAFAYGIEKKMTSKKGISMLNAIKSVNFKSPLTRNSIKFNDKGVNFDIVSIVYNIQDSVVNGIELIKSGIWNSREDRQLSLNTKVLRWKDGSANVPVSKCSHDCMQGNRRVPPKSGPVCCWKCEPCPNDTVSGSNNSATCDKCGTLQVANPDQSSCFNFKKISFKWFEPLGEFLMFFITAGMCVTLFTLGIFSQNRDCDVVKSADYKIMVFMLFGLSLCFFAPVPLLLEPSPASCISYVILFNFGLTIPLATLFTKSASVRHRFFDENMELQNKSLGSKPHLLVIAAVLVGQAIILAIGIRFTSAYVEYYPTDNWDIKYAECAYVKNVVFWVGFAYNVILSIVLSFLSCKSVKMNDDFKELKWVCITTCCFYFMSFIFITCIYSVFGKHVVEAASIMIIIFGFMFLITYFFPKLRLILFHQPKKDLGPDGKPLMSEEEKQPEVKLSPHISGIAAFGKVRVLAVKVRDKKKEDEEPLASKRRNVAEPMPSSSKA